MTDDNISRTSSATATLALRPHVNCRMHVLDNTISLAYARCQSRAPVLAQSSIDSDDQLWRTVTYVAAQEDVRVSRRQNPSSTVAQDGASTPKQQHN